MPFLHAVILGGIPSLFMLLSTYIGLGREVPDNIAGALQHFAAGVLLCTVGTELLPPIVNATGWLENIAACIGFFCGVSVLIILGLFSPSPNANDEEEGEEEDDDDDEQQSPQHQQRHHHSEQQQNGTRGHTRHSQQQQQQQVRDDDGKSPRSRRQIHEMKFVIAGRKFRQRQTILASRTTTGGGGRLAMNRSLSLSSLPLVSSIAVDDNDLDVADEQSSLLPSSSSPSQPSKMKQKNNHKNNHTKKGPSSPRRGSHSYDSTTTDEMTTTGVGGGDDVLDDDGEQAFTTIKENSITITPPPETDGKVNKFPIVFLLAVAIDSSLDGLLIGIASAAGKSAGPMMSASLSVEMSFLGLTLATTLQGQSMPKAVVAAMVGPICLVLAAGLGGLMADALSHSPVFFVGMLSFGASALLFMVAEELLLDAHEDGEHIWWVDLQLYTGFFASIIAGKFVR